MTTTDIKETKVTGRAPRLRAQIALCFFAFILIGANDGAFGVLIPSMRSHYGVSNATIGLLFLFASVGYLIAAFNSGLWSQNWATASSCCWEWERSCSLQR